MSPSLDTVCWIARDPAVLLAVGEVLLPPCRAVMDGDEGSVDASHPPNGGPAPPAPPTPPPSF